MTIASAMARPRPRAADDDDAGENRLGAVGGGVFVLHARRFGARLGSADTPARASTRHGALRPRRARHARGDARGRATRRGVFRAGRSPATHPGGGGSGVRARARSRWWERRIARGRSVRLGFEDKVGRVERPSALASDPSRRMHETRGMSRWQARATYGDAGRGPADGIWPPPAVGDAADPDVDSAADPDPDPGRPHPDHPRSVERRAPESHRSALRDRRDAFLASVAAKGPRPPSPGVHHGRWRDQARGPDPKRHPPDVHAGRHEARAFYGDGGGRSVARSRADIDADGGADTRAAGRIAPTGTTPTTTSACPTTATTRNTWDAISGKPVGTSSSRAASTSPDGKRDVGTRVLGASRGVGARPDRPSDPQAGPRGQKPVGPRTSPGSSRGVGGARPVAQRLGGTRAERRRSIGTRSSRRGSTRRKMASPRGLGSRRRRRDRGRDRTGTGRRTMTVATRVGGRNARRFRGRTVAVRRRRRARRESRRRIESRARARRGR